LRQRKIVVSVVAAAAVADAEAKAVQEAGVIVNGPVAPLNHRGAKARTAIVAPVALNLNGNEDTICPDNKAKRVVAVVALADISHPVFLTGLLNHYLNPKTIGDPRKTHQRWSSLKRK
jgi:hypothetical protein